MDAVWIRDPDGRRVSLSDETWERIGDHHPELWMFHKEALRAITHPDRRARGRRDDEESFLVARLGPSRWLRVVVQYEDGTGSVVAAVARRTTP